MSDQVWMEGAIWRGNLLWSIIISLLTFVPIMVSLLLLGESIKRLARRRKNRIYLFFAFFISFPVVFADMYIVLRALTGFSITIAGFKIPILPTLTPPTCKLAKKYGGDGMICDMEHFESFVAGLVKGQGWEQLLTPVAVQMIGIYVAVSLLLGYFSMGRPFVDIYCVECERICTVHDGEVENYREWHFEALLSAKKREAIRMTGRKDWLHSAVEKNRKSHDVCRTV